MENEKKFHETELAKNFQLQMTFVAEVAEKKFFWKNKMKKEKKKFLLKKSKLEAKEQNWIWQFGGILLWRKLIRQKTTCLG